MATLADGGLITHERCIVRCVTASGAAGCLHHEVITWHHGTVRVPGEVPPTETAALRLLQRCSRRREPCGGCAPGGEVVPQPCAHVAARARGVVFSRGWADYMDLLVATPVKGTAHFELQQPATAAAAMADPRGGPAGSPAAAHPDAMALSGGSSVSPPGASAPAATVAPAGATLTQEALDAASAVLPPVSYQCEHFILDSPRAVFQHHPPPGDGLGRGLPAAAERHAAGSTRRHGRCPCCRRHRHPHGGPGGRRAAPPAPITHQPERVGARRRAIVERSAART